jgi:Brp/Blh family beta-carotene 15,15'-monooxygenase
MERGTLLVALLLGSLLTAQVVLPAWSEWSALGLVIIAGIPHGSFDLRVAEAKWSRGANSKKLIVSLYVGSVLAMSGLCVMLPPVGLALFLGISALHFVEGEGYGGSRASHIKAALFGTSAILLPIGLHPGEAGEYVGYFLSPGMYGALAPFISGAAMAAVPILSGVVLFDSFRKSTDAKRDALQRALCLVGWVALSPLAGFAVWFIGRHSRLHLEACREMFQASRFGVPFDFILISALAIIGLSPFALWFDFTDINQLFAASISLIAGLTFPHIFVAHGLREVGEGRKL